MIRTTFVLAILLMRAMELAGPAAAQVPGTAARLQDPVATAQAADQWASEQQRRAHQAAAAAQAARATADAAWAEATAQAAAVTATARWVATATPAAATAQAQATQDALAVEGTRQAIYAQATQAAQDAAVQATATAQSLGATATKGAAIAEQDRLFLEMDRLTLERSRRLAPLYTWGPWVVTGIFVVLAIWAVWRLVPLLQERWWAEPLGYVGAAGSTRIDTIEGEFTPRRSSGSSCALIASTVEAGRWRRVVLRPIPPEESKRPPVTGGSGETRDSEE